MTRPVVLDDAEAVHGYVSRVCFKKGPPLRIGAELEFLLTGADPHRPVPLTQTRAALDLLGPLPGGSNITFEPGGQVELSSPPATDVTSLVSGLQADVDALIGSLAGSGLGVLDTAVDPLRQPLRQLDSPRYDAMEVYFDGLEATLDPCDRVGRAMMASTAAIQVNLDAGEDPAARWRLLHDLGPVLVAAFANSPQRCGRRTGWKSSRQQIWQTLDPQRTASCCDDRDPAAAYADFALDAPVMLPTGRGGTFRAWVESGDGPTEAELADHLTTLFPPVRPRGWFEVRYLDAQPLRWWPVPVALLSALLDDDDTTTAAAAVARPARGLWTEAGRDGLADPVLRRAAQECFALATATLTRYDSLLVDLVERYAAAYVLRGRCPADDPVLPEHPVEAR